MPFNWFRKDEKDRVWVSKEAHSKMQFDTEKIALFIIILCMATIILCIV